MQQQNRMMPTNEEKAAFAKRLKSALRRSPEPVNGATELALRFNLRYEGNSVSPQTVHNWLAGRTIPTVPKIAALATWLKVDEHWLHYGPPPAKKSAESLKKNAKNSEKPSADALHLALRIEELPANWLYMLEEFVELLHQDLS